MNLEIELDGPVLKYYREQYRRDTLEQARLEMKGISPSHPASFEDYMAYTALLLLTSLYESEVVQ